MFKQQKQIITDFISKNPKLSSKEIAAELNLNYNSVRGRISELKKSKILQVNDESEYVFIGSWFKKILKTGSTQNAVAGGTESLWAYTFEAGSNEEPDRYNFLKRKIINKFGVTVPRGGYDYQEVNDFEKEDTAVYPLFEIGSGVSID